MKKRAKKFVPILILILLPIVFFQKAALGETIIVSGDFTGSDLIDLHLPFKQILHQNYPQGKLPLWEPNLSLGFPVFAEGQSGPLFPPHVLFALLPAHLGLTLSILTSFILTALSTFIYARSLKLTQFSALVSAITFAFSAFFITRLKHLNLISVAAWVPFLFWTTKKLFEKRNLSYALLTGIGIAFQFLAGHPQMAFFCLSIFLIYFLFESALAIKNHGFEKIFPLASLSLLILTLISLGLSAVQILPTLELTQLSERTAYTLQTATAYPFHPKNLLTFISPYYFGNPARGTYREDIRTTGVFWENSSYIGLLPFFLAIAAFISAARKKPRPTYQFFFAGLALFSLILMLGRFSPIYSLLWQLLPGFQLFRFPTRFNLFLIFSLALLSGSGASLLLKKLISLANRPPGLRKTVPEETRFSWPLSLRQTQVAIIGFILIDLIVFASAYIAYVPLNEFQKEPAIAKRLAEDNSFFRIYSLTQYTQSPYQALGWKSDQEAILAMREAIPPNNNLLYNLASFTDRGWFEGGLSLARRNRLENYLLYENQDPVVTGKILGIFNVKYIISFSESLGIEIEKIDEYDLGKQFASKLNLFKNNLVMPRVSFVPEAEVIQDEEAILNRLTQAEFLPNKTVILEDQPNKIPEKFIGIMDAFREENPVKILSYKDREVTIEADIKTHGFLVLADLYYPGWKAQVDGKIQPILKANYLVRALELEPGKHTIRFYFDPLSFKIGGIISILTTTIIASLLLIHVAKKLIKLHRS